MQTKTIVILGQKLLDSAIEIAAKRDVRIVSIKPYSTPEEIATIVGKEKADAIIVRRAEVSTAVIAASDRLKVIVKHGVGVNAIDVTAATERGIPVLITNGVNAQSVAEHAFGLMFSVARTIPLSDKRMREGHWDAATHAGIELSGKCLGIVGFGNIGRTLINLVRPLNMTVRVFDPYFGSGAAIEGVELVKNIDDMLAVSDFVSLHCPLTAQTRNLMGAKQFDRMSSTSYLINTARGELVDTEALIDALETGKIAGAGLDCFFPEPPPADSALWRLPNLVATPHIGANTEAAAQRVGVRAMQLTLAVLDGLKVDEKAVVNGKVCCN